MKERPKHVVTTEIVKVRMSNASNSFRLFKTFSGFFSVTFQLTQSFWRKVEIVEILNFSVFKILERHCLRRASQLNQAGQRTH
jgi:hypothetical protein